MEFTNGTSRLRVSGGSDSELARASFDGDAPKLEHVGERVRVRYPRSLLALLKSKPKRGEVRLCTAIPWEITINGGASDVECVLSELLLQSFKLRGGADRLSLTLSPPSTHVPVEITGGAARLSVTRSPTTAVRVRVAGGATKVELDSLRLDSVGGELRWESPGLSEAQPLRHPHPRWVRAVEARRRVAARYGPKASFSLPQGTRGGDAWSWSADVTGDFISVHTRAC